MLLLRWENLKHLMRAISIFWASLWKPSQVTSVLRKRWEIFSVFCQNRLFCTTFIINFIEVNVSSLERNLYWSRASGGQVLRYSAYSRDCEVFFQKRHPGNQFEYGLNTNTNFSNVFFTFLHNGERTGCCKANLKEGLGLVLKALPAGRQGVLWDLRGGGNKAFPRLVEVPEVAYLILDLCSCRNPSHKTTKWRTHHCW